MSGAPDDEDDEHRTPPPRDVALEAWKIADRTDRRIDKWRVHLFGFEDDAGRLGRMEDTMNGHAITLKEHGALHTKHDHALDKLDRIGWKILVTCGVGAGAAMAIVEVLLRVVGGSH
jgi:hypothetical protein